MEMIRDNKVWISFEVDKELYQGLHDHAQEVTLTVEQVIIEMIRQKTKNKIVED